MSGKNPKEIDESLERMAKSWERIAKLRDEEAEREAPVVGDVTAIRNQAKTARDAAKALRMEIETGKTHCVCCLIPIEQCHRRKPKV